MSLKRPRDLSSSPASSTPPRAMKRRHISLNPSSSPSSSPPYTPFMPSDSPGNPFGRKWALKLARHLDLPPPTSFSKHLPLRFTAVVPGTSLEAWRVVQVPLSYTFRHLHQLILYLYGGKQACSKNGHLFEVQKDVQLLKGENGTARVRTGRTTVKLSTVRDPYRYRADENADEDAGGSGSEAEGEDWHWEAEEDMTLGHVWTSGPSLKKGIIFHHDATSRLGVQVHITINTTRVPARKGKGNKPFTFSASGRLKLSSPALSSRRTRSSTKQSQDGLDPDQVRQWNMPETFTEFLRSATAPDADEEDADGETDAEFDDGATDAGSTVSSTYSDPFDPITPFPPTHSLRARRVERVGRRLSSLTKKNMHEVLGQEDEEDEVDELADDDDDEEPGRGSKKTAALESEEEV